MPDTSRTMEDTSSRFRPLKVGLHMLLMGLLVGWIFALAIPLAVEEELSSATVNRLPVYGFAVGAGLGLTMHFAATMRDIMFVLIGSVILGAMAWFFSMIVLRGVLLLVELPLETVDAVSEWVGPIAFAVGPILGLAAAVILGYEKIEALRARARSRSSRPTRKQRQH